MVNQYYKKITSDGSELFFQLTKPEGPIKAVLCLIHGQGDHGGCFEYLRDFFSDKSYGLISVDLHGNGASSGKRGHIDNFEKLLDDIDVLLSEASEKFPESPVFLYGHSLGGNLVIHHSLKRKSKVAGVIASSPWLRLTINPLLVRPVAFFLDIFKPDYLIDVGIDAGKLSKDSIYTVNYAKDPLVHGNISGHMLAGACKAGAWNIRHAGEFNLPLLLQHGSADQVTSHQATELFFNRTHNKDIQLKIWEGNFHSLHNEVNRVEIFENMFSFLLPLI